MLNSCQVDLIKTNFSVRYLYFSMKIHSFRWVPMMPKHFKIWLH